MIRSGAGARRRRRLSIGLPPNNGEYRAGGMTDNRFRGGPEEHCAERFARLATDHDKVSSSAVGLRDDLLGAVPLADDLVRNSRLVTLRPMVATGPRGSAGRMVPLAGALLYFGGKARRRPLALHGCAADPVLPANLRRLHPCFGLLQKSNNLLLRETPLPHLLASFGLLYPGRTLFYTGTVLGGRSPDAENQRFVQGKSSDQAKRLLIGIGLVCGHFLGSLSEGLRALCVLLEDSNL